MKKNIHLYLCALFMILFSFSTTLSANGVSNEEKEEIFKKVQSVFAKQNIVLNHQQIIKDGICNLSEQLTDLTEDTQKELIEELSHFIWIKIVILSKNKLHSLPEFFTQLTALHGLDLSENQIHALPDSFRQLTTLKLLDLSKNQFSSLPECLRELSELQWLNLTNNKLQSLPEFFGELSELQ